MEGTERVMNNGWTLWGQKRIEQEHERTRENGKGHAHSDDGMQSHDQPMCLPCAALLMMERAQHPRKREMELACCSQADYLGGQTRQRAD